MSRPIDASVYEQMHANLDRLQVEDAADIIDHTEAVS